MLFWGRQPYDQPRKRKNRRVQIILGFTGLVMIYKDDPVAILLHYQHAGSANRIIL